MTDFIKEKEIELDGKRFILSRFPATEGKRIIAGYTTSMIPKLSDWESHQKISYENLSYVQFVTASGQKVQLLTKEIINNHIDSWETLVLLEWKMIEYNSSFLQDGQVSKYLVDLARSIKHLNFKTLMGLLAQLSQAEKPPLAS